MSNETSKWRIAFGLPLLAIAGCAAASSSGPSASSLASSSSASALVERGEAKPAPVPIADHHIHLLSPAAANWKTPPPLPEIKLPADLARVLRLRNERQQNQKALKNLYTSDALYHRGGGVGWARGNKAAAGHVVWTISDFPYRIVPVAYNRNGSSAQVAGYFLETNDYSDSNLNGFHSQVSKRREDFTERFGTALLSLRKDADAQWRIAAETYIYNVPTFEKPVTAADKIKEMDAMGVRLGTVVSNAYYYDSAQPEPPADALSMVRADNDWTAQQVAQYPDRLIAFCSVDPVEVYALVELERCAASGKFVGLKLHFNAAQVKLRESPEVAKIRAVMVAANRHRMPMIIHVRPGNDYDAEIANIFLRQLVAAAPDVPIQIAHFWGGESYASSALKIYADAVSAGDPVTRNLYFDVSAVLMQERKPAEIQEIVSRMRQIGMGRLFWGSDAPMAEAWGGFRKNVPLTQDEIRQIASNVAPYLVNR